MIVRISRKSPTLSQEHPPSPPQQARSRASERRLLAAARRVLAAKSFDRVSVAEIAAAAGLTVGGFYSRFASKEALLERLEREVFDETRALVARIATLAGRGAPPLELLGALVGDHVRFYRRNSAVVRALVVRSRSDTELSEQLRELSRQNYAVVAEALAAGGEIRHADARVALEFALYAERSVLREAVLFGEGWAKERRWSDARIAAETVKLVASYLGLSGPDGNERKTPRETRSRLTRSTRRSRP
jgi:AcrR family transcriptional regulator